MRRYFNALFDLGGVLETIPTRLSEYLKILQSALLQDKTFSNGVYKVQFHIYTQKFDYKNLQKQIHYNLNVKRNHKFSALFWILNAIYNGQAYFQA